jgi:hypothetical protein
LVAGVAFFAVAVTLVIRRHSLARKEAARGRVAMGPTGWTVLGTLIALVGLLQLATAAAYASAFAW